MNKENKSKLLALLEKVANERDLEICGLNIQTSQNPIVIGNGFKLSNYIFQESKDGPLGWVGRVAPEKGLEDAAYVANAMGEKLNVWGLVQDESYALKVEKLFSPGILVWKGFFRNG